MSENQFLQFRNELGLDRAQMAAFLDVPRGTYNKWENGERKKQNAAAVSLLNLWRQLNVLYPDLVKSRTDAIK